MLVNCYKVKSYFLYKHPDKAGLKRSDHTSLFNWTMVASRIIYVWINYIIKCTYYSSWHRHHKFHSVHTYNTHPVHPLKYKKIWILIYSSAFIYSSPKNRILDNICNWEGKNTDYNSHVTRVMLQPSYRRSGWGMFLSINRKMGTAANNDSTVYLVRDNWMWITEWIFQSEVDSTMCTCNFQKAKVPPHNKALIW